MKVVVTGAAGYIGGQTLLQLTDAGHDVLAIDRVPPPGHLMTVPCSWHTGDFVSPLGLDAIKLFCPDAIVHCAGTSLVGPSMITPEDYYNNNFVKTKTLLDFLVDNHYKKVRFVFSSSAATYGNPIMTPCQEVDPVEPISPYGESKLMIEWMLKVIIGLTDWTMWHLDTLMLAEQTVKSDMARPPEPHTLLLVF
jgi:UDP-glucose 4-epimerase